MPAHPHPTEPPEPKSQLRPSEPNAQSGDTALFHAFNVIAVREVRLQIVQVALWLQNEKEKRAGLVFDGKALIGWRLSNEVDKVLAVLSDSVRVRLGVGIRGAHVIHPLGQADQPSAWAEPAFTKDITAMVAKAVMDRGGLTHRNADARYVIMHLLLDEYFQSTLDHARQRPSGMTRRLALASGFSHVTVARILKEIRGYKKSLGRESPFRLAQPELIVRELMALAPKRRGTRLFSDHSGMPRSVNALYQRFIQLKRDDLAVGGILGAKHYHEDLDVNGTPRLDVTLHSPHGRYDLDFVNDLDPGLQPCEDGETPVLAVHLLQRQESRFNEKDGVLVADRVDCLLDLDELALPGLARGFLDHLSAHVP